MEVDLGKGLHAEVNLCMDSWPYVQEVDYDQLPFKCKSCHKFGHFTKGYLKGGVSIENQPGDPKEQW